MRLRYALALLASCGLIALTPTGASAEGGLSVAAAPAITYGQQQFGNTALGKRFEDSCFLGFDDYYASYWSLPVTAGDVVTINWEGVPGTTLRLYPIGTSDFTIYKTEPTVRQELLANGRNQMQYTVPASGAMPLEYAVCEEDLDEVPGPYDFTATAQHGLAVGLAPREHIRTNSVVYGNAALITGGPVPDGMSFTLAATWPGGSASYAATTMAGALAFTLALPDETQGQHVKLSLGRAVDSQYLAPKAAEIETLVAKPRVEPPLPQPKRHRKHRRHRKHHHRHHRHHHHR